MIPVCLVTGFLGSGKTTLLRNLAERYRDRKLVFLVNDFARLDVDGALMKEAGDAVLSISGGSIFCKCLVTDFIRELRRIHRGEAAYGAPPEGVIIEASGMADPRVFQRMLGETGLDRHFEIASILTVVDPGRFLKLIHTLPNIRTQVEAADTVLVNKQDLYDPPTLLAAEQEILRISPSAEMSRTVNAAFEGDVFQPRSRMPQDGDYAKCADPRYASFVLTDLRPDIDALMDALRDERDNLYRVKGEVPVGESRYFVEFDGSRFRADPVESAAANPGGLAFIVPGHLETQVRTRLEERISPPNVAPQEIPRAG